MSGLKRIIQADVNKDGAPSLDEVQQAFSPEATRAKNEAEKK